MKRIWKNIYICFAGVDCVRPGWPIRCDGESKEHHARWKEYVRKQPLLVHNYHRHRCMFLQDSSRLLVGVRSSQSKLKPILILSDTVFAMRVILNNIFLQQTTREVSLWLAINLCVIIYVFIIMVFIYWLFSQTHVPNNYRHGLIGLLLILNGKFWAETACFDWIFSSI